jgi:hypothetical protein
MSHTKLILGKLAASQQIAAGGRDRGTLRNFHLHGFILRDASLRDAPQDEDSNPHGEERGFARLEP